MTPVTAASEAVAASLKRSRSVLPKKPKKKTENSAADSSETTKARRDNAHPEFLQVDVRKFCKDNQAQCTGRLLDAVSQAAQDLFGAGRAILRFTEQKPWMSFHIVGVWADKARPDGVNATALRIAAEAVIAAALIGELRELKRTGGKQMKPVVFPQIVRAVILLTTAMSPEEQPPPKAKGTKPPRAKKARVALPTPANDDNDNDDDADSDGDGGEEEDGGSDGEDDGEYADGSGDSGVRDDAEDESD